MEKDAAGKTGIIEQEGQKITDLNIRIMQQQEAINQSNSKCEQIYELLKRRTEQSENESIINRRLNEQGEAMAAKISHLTNPDQMGDVAMQKKLEEYQRLLRCQSCNDRLKTTVLLKCMHTFWYFF